MVLSAQRKWLMPVHFWSFGLVLSIKTIRIWTRKNAHICLSKDFCQWIAKVIFLDFWWNYYKLITFSWNPHKLIAFSWNPQNPIIWTKLIRYFVKSPQTDCFFVKSPETNYLDEINFAGCVLVLRHAWFCPGRHWSFANRLAVRNVLAMIIVKMWSNLVLNMPIRSQKNGVIKTSSLWNA